MTAADDYVQRGALPGPWGYDYPGDDQRPQPCALRFDLRRLLPAEAAGGYPRSGPPTTWQAAKPLSAPSRKSSLCTETSAGAVGASTCIGSAEIIGGSSSG
jgi:hypothetical protein